MANEITGSYQFRVSNGNFQFNTVESFTYDQATAGGANPGTVNVGTSEEAISLGDITTNGWALIKNLDSTNYVTWGPESGGAMVALGRLEAGEVALLRLTPSALTLRMQANTAACDVLIQVFED